MSTADHSCLTALYYCDCEQDVKKSKPSVPSTKTQFIFHSIYPIGQKLCERQKQQQGYIQIISHCTCEIRSSPKAIYLKRRNLRVSSSLQPSSLSLISVIIQHQAANKYKIQKKTKKKLHTIQSTYNIITSRTIPTPLLYVIRLPYKY